MRNGQAGAGFAFPEFETARGPGQARVGERLSEAERVRVILDLDRAYGLGGDGFELFQLRLAAAFGIGGIPNVAQRPARSEGVDLDGHKIAKPRVEQRLVHARPGGADGPAVRVGFDAGRHGRRGHAILERFPGELEALDAFRVQSLDPESRKAFGHPVREGGGDIFVAEVFGFLGTAPKWAGLEMERHPGTGRGIDQRPVVVAQG